MAVQQEVRERVASLRREIEHHNRLYYQEARPEISDFEFDRLMEELLGLEAAHPELAAPDSPSQRVGGTVTKNFPTVTHREPMLSLANTYSLDEVREFHDRTGRLLEAEGIGERSMVAELKFDGVAVSLLYRDGLLFRGATRGDGRQGDDITANIRTIRSIPLRLQAFDSPFQEGEGREIEVRGEVFMRKDDFEAMNDARPEEERFANPRNATAGTLKLQDSAEVARRRLQFVAYFLRGLDDERTPHLERLQLLEKAGFNTGGHYRRCCGVEEVADFIGEWSEERLRLPYETDGVVLKLDDVAAWARIGATSKSPRWAIAYKYPAQQAVTTLRDIVYQVGRLGTITPVAELEPVRLAGSTISRSTLHNFDEMERLGVMVGDRVVIEKSGEVIPKVIRVVVEERPAGASLPELPETCPECGTALEKPENEVSFYCPNVEACPAQVRGRLLHFASRNAMDIQSLGESLVEQLVGRRLVHDPGDLYALEEERLAGLERMGKRSAENLLKALDGSRSKPFERLLYALGIRHVGQATARELATAFPSMEKLQAASEEALAETPDVGPVIARSVREWFSRPSVPLLLEKLRAAGLQLASDGPKALMNTNFAGLTVVFTGTLQRYGRSEAAELVQQRGGKVSGSVSKKSGLVVAGAEAGSKLEKAEKLGVRVVSEEEFEAML